MSWWGKLVGGTLGFMIGGPLGAILGVALGHNFDKGLQGMPEGGFGREDFSPDERERIQTVFFTATFSVMGAVAKADGRVSPEEIHLAESVMAQMNLSPQMRKTAIRLFNEGKRADFPLQEVVQQFRQECRRRTTLLQMFLEIQIQAAYADGRLDTAEDALLQRICRLLGVSEFEYRRLQRMIGARYGAGAEGAGYARPDTGVPSLEQAYQILGVEPTATDAEVKRAYRRLLSQHHPDKLVSKGLPEEMMQVATQKTHEIKQAWERIRRERGLK
ncbi:MAG: co-chaperone DjlA [Gammaproteobacteria bacterium]|nr:MAG: co-chaperone DjlA [Gammaproteobacteria bacterium]